MPGINFVTLRPHHLLCILTYVGEGYSNEFVQNFNYIIDTINSGSPVKITQEPDDICAACSDKNNPDYHCQNDEIKDQDIQALSDLRALLPKIDFSYNATIFLDKLVIAALRRSFKKGTIRKSCAGCPWHNLCDTIANTNYKGTLLK